MIDSETCDDHASSVWAQLPLNPGSNHIRLLEIHEGTDPQIECSMSIAPLYAPPRYQALSYCWGPPASSNSIRCNSQPIPVQDSLYAALKQLRAKGYRRIWADAICIDQSDGVEKSHQVGIMDDIYEMAESTLVYLGTPKSHGSHAFDIVRQLAGAHSKYVVEVETWQRRLPLPEQELISLGLPAWDKDPERFLQPLYELLSAPWTTRAWCVQECVLAREVICLWGDQMIPWTILHNAVTVILGLSIWSAYSKRDRPGWDEALFNIGTVRNHLQEFLMSTSLNVDFVLGTLLIMHFPRECQDPRDKVYSLLGILRRLSKRVDGYLTTIPDYSKPVEDVYKQFMHDLLSSAQFLDPLDVLNGSQSARVLATPSWVIDWIGLGQEPPMLTTSLVRSGYRRLQTCSGGRKELQIESNSLQLKCQSFDTLDMVSELPAVLKDWSDPQYGLLVRGHYRQNAMIADWTMVCKPPRTGNYVVGDLTNLQAMYAAFLMRDPADVAHLASRAESWARRIDEVLTVIASLQLLVLSDRERYQDTIEEYRKAGVLTANTYDSQVPAMKLAKTARGYYCSVPYKAETGDEIVICSGGRNPFLCRPAADNNDRWTLFGACYVQGIMNGEAWKPEHAEYRWFE